jgi:hypothetical protein
MNDESKQQILELVQSALGREVHTDELFDLVIEVADMAFSLYWDSGGPGAGAGYNRVYHLAGKYFTAVDDFWWDGPCDTLAEMCPTIGVNGATREVWCGAWSEEEILDRIEIFGEFDGVEINGTWWPFERLEHEVARRSSNSREEAR